MKIGFILIISCCTAGLAAARLDRRAGQSKSKTNKSELNAPLLPGNPSSSAPSSSVHKVKPATHANVKATVHTGPHHQGTLMEKGAGLFGTGKYKDVRKASSKTMTASDHYSAKLRGWAGRAGKVENEGTGNRVKVKMDVENNGFAVIDRKLSDGSWTQDVVSDPGTQRRYYQNQDGSPVTVKSTLLGGGNLRTTADVHPRPLKRGRKLEPE